MHPESPGLIPFHGTATVEQALPMFLHHQTHRSPSDLTHVWWSVETETLTLARCSRDSRARLAIEIVGPETSPEMVCSHPAPFEPGPFAGRLLTECRRIGPASVRLTDTEIIPHREAAPPEWLLLNSRTGDTPAIMHTSEPVFIALADPASAVLHAPEYFRLLVDLPVEGWEYWWTDAQQHFEKLTLDSCESFGMPVPKEIRDLA